MKLNIRALDIPDLKLIRTTQSTDPRGYFEETYVHRDFVAAGIDYAFVQDNQTGSKVAGTVRGLHFQAPPFTQAKLIRVLRGRIFDIAVDLRGGSPSYGRHVIVELDSSSQQQLLVPEGFAHGYCTLESETEIFYKVTNAYSSDHERGINWADPALGIRWPIGKNEAILSDKDRLLPMLADLPIFFA